MYLNLRQELRLSIFLQRVAPVRLFLRFLEEISLLLPLPSFIDYFFSRIGDIAVFACTKFLRKVFITNHDITGIIASSFQPQSYDFIEPLDQLAHFDYGSSGNLNVFDKTPFIEHVNLERTQCKGVHDLCLRYFTVDPILILILTP